MLARMFPHHQVIVNGCGPVGTSVATLTCGQVRPAKFRLTICEYWIWIPGTRIFFGSEGSFGGDVMANTGVGACDSLGIVGFNSRVPGAVSRGTFTSYATVSIQNLAVMTAAWALGTPAFPSGGRVVMVACVPARKEMFAVPPPFSVASVGPVETSKVMVSLISRPWMARWRTKLGFLMMSVVMVPALMNLFDDVSIVANQNPSKDIRLEILRNPWPVRLHCVHGLEDPVQSVGDDSNRERRGIEDRERRSFRFSA